MSILRNGVRREYGRKFGFSTPRLVSARHCVSRALRQTMSELPDPLRDI